MMLDLFLIVTLVISLLLVIETERIKKAKRRARTQRLLQYIGQSPAPRKLPANLSHSWRG